jgi:hypothetical protein
MAAEILPVLEVLLVVVMAVAQAAVILEDQVILEVLAEEVVMVEVTPEVAVVEAEILEEAAVAAVTLEEVEVLAVILAVEVLEILVKLVEPTRQQTIMEEK